MPVAARTSSVEALGHRPRVAKPDRAAIVLEAIAGRGPAWGRTPPGRKTGRLEIILKATNRQNGREPPALALEWLRGSLTPLHLVEHLRIRRVA